MSTAKLIAPFATWMFCLSVLPATPIAYAIRTALTLIVLIWSLCGRDRVSLGPNGVWELIYGLAAGLFVFVVWVAPESLAWYRRWCIFGEGGTQAIAESSTLLVTLRLFGSAFVISAAEELFFRLWLIGFAGFPWMILLFAVEHDRWLVGALAGLVYGLLYLRKGLFSAIVAHATTNLVLGIWVIVKNQWQFW